MVTEFWEPVERLHEKLSTHDFQIAVAESCTGGLLGGAITSVPGSSACFAGGVIAYNNELKRDLLDVPDSELREHGAVSSPVAESMARGVRGVVGASVALSITGIAGPGGGSEEKPVGLVYMGYVGADRSEVKHAVFEGDRATVRKRSVNSALELALDQLE